MRQILQKRKHRLRTVLHLEHLSDCTLYSVNLVLLLTELLFYLVCRHVF